MAVPVPPRAMAGHTEQEHEDVGGEEEFTFPTPPQPQVLFGKDCSASASSSPPAWLLSSPIRRSFSAADCAASPWRLARRQHLLHGGACCSPALSDYDAAAGFCFDDEAEEEEERMDSLWEDLKDHDAAAAARRTDDGLLFIGSSLEVSRRRSVAGDRVTKAANKDQRAGDRVPAGAQAAALGASRSLRRRPPGLVVMMHALKRMFVAHKAKSRVHRDELSTASAEKIGYLPPPIRGFAKLPPFSLASPNCHPPHEETKLPLPYPFLPSAPGLTVTPALSVRPLPRALLPFRRRRDAEGDGSPASTSGAFPGEQPPSAVGLLPRRDSAAAWCTGLDVCRQ